MEALQSVKVRIGAWQQLIRTERAIEGARLLMKAIVYTHYGPPDVLQLKEVEKPLPQDHQLLIKVHAASIKYT